MALVDITIDFDLAQLLGSDFDARRTKAYVTTNVESGTLMDTSTGETRLGDEAVTIADDGTGSFTTWATGADGNPISWQTSLVVDYPRTGQRDRKRRVFGPYTLVAANDGDNITDLEDEQAVPAEYLTTLTAELEQYVIDAGAAADGFDIGTVTTGIAGSSATASITGTAPNKELNLTIPRGDVGDTGPQGLPGVNAVANDTATASYVEDPGSLTNAALLASFSTADVRAALASAAASAMRPRNYVKAYTVDAATANGSAFGVYQTFAAAKTAVENDISAADTNSGLVSKVRSTPARRRVIYATPGTYTEDLQLPNHCDLIGTGAKPSDTILTSSGASTGCTLNAQSVSSFISNIRVVDTSSVNTRHPFRAGTLGSDSTANYDRIRQTVICDRVEFASSATSGDEGAAMDPAIDAGVTLVFTRCRFESPHQSQAISVVFTNSARTAPAYCIFLDCHVVANKYQPADGDPWPGYESQPVALVTQNVNRRDVFAWYGGSFDVEGYYPLDTDCHIAMSGTTGNQCMWYMDSSIPLKLQGAGVSTDNVVDFTEAALSLPLNGMSREEEAAYLPDADTTKDAPQTVESGYTSTGQAALTANRIYYVRMPIRATLRPSFSTIGVGTASGSCVMGYYIDDGTGNAPSTDVNQRAISDVDALVPVQTFQTWATTARRLLWRGLKYVWVAFAIDNATATVDVVADATTAGMKVLYKDSWDGVSQLGSPTGLSSLPAGQAAPLPVLWNYSETNPYIKRTSGAFTVTLDPKVKAVTAIMSGGGGGGGGGRRGAAGSARPGGGSGGGAGLTKITVNIQALASRTLTGTVGAAGTAGAAATADTTSGGAGGGGGATTLFCAGVEIARADGGGGGGGGGAGVAGSAGSAGSGNTGTAAAGVASQASGAGPGGANSSVLAGQGGGAGGGVTTGDVSNGGGAGASDTHIGTGAAGAAGAVGANGGAGSASRNGSGPGSGGGGGGGSITGAGGNGGAGGPGSGGGGGGGSLNGNNSGAGGAGGPGFIIIIPHL